MVRTISLWGFSRYSTIAFALYSSVVLAQTVDSEALQQVTQQNTWTAASLERYKGDQKQPISKSSNGTKVSLSKQNLASSTDTKDKNHKASALQQEPAQSFPTASSKVTLDHDFWVFDAYLTFLEDWDHDGYYYRFELAFDVDTIFNHADVYARLYLGDGHTFREYHTTSVFHIDDTDSDDKFYVETELLSGFPSHDYDILIELYDADNDHLVATFDHNNDTDLSYRPLESYDYETYVTPSGGASVVNRERGGSIGIWALALIAVALLRRRTLTSAN